MSQWFSPETFGIYIGSTCTKWRRWWRQVMPSARMRKTSSYFQNAARDDAGSVPHPAAARVKQLSGANSGEKSKITIRGLPSCSSSLPSLTRSTCYRERGEHAGNAGYLPAGNGDGALGLTTHVSALKKAGAKPLLWHWYCLPG